MKVVSGGQTGVDRAAWDAAHAVGWERGGWVPRGRRAEDGPIPGRYPCRETPSREYIERTERNVLESDATLVVTFGSPRGGTRRTIGLCAEHTRPLHVIDLAGSDRRKFLDETEAFILRRMPTRLNVAGPRDDPEGRVYREAYEFLCALFGRIRDRGARDPARRSRTPAGRGSRRDGSPRRAPS